MTIKTLWRITLIFILFTILLSVGSWLADRINAPTFPFEVSLCVIGLFLLIAETVSLIVKLTLRWKKGTFDVDTHS